MYIIRCNNNNDILFYIPLVVAEIIFVRRQREAHKDPQALGMKLCVA